ncbi:MAG: sigma-70 family RNA polymerase sigma factor [Kofleriaceae bacterium]|nr:sigma-70 family RNA polymerase sigma factor [Kofleriaceae bacterium]MCL4223833.1 sigma-70 family RNA polymerase sigma factor [Myxococcales bacterium]
MLSRRRDSRRDFEATALPHLDALYGAAYRLARNPRDAEDLVQEALLRAYRFWDTFEKDSNCRAWLLRILTNTFINEYQRRRRQREVLDAATAEQTATDGVLVHEGAQAQRSPEGVLLERAVSDDVQRALDALPADFRTAVVLCDVEGLAYKEIAEVMDCPVGTVMSRLFRGRRLLQQSLAQFAVEQGYVKAPSAAPAASPPDDAGGEAAAAPIDLGAYRSRRPRS